MAARHVGAVVSVAPAAVRRTFKSCMVVCVAVATTGLAGLAGAVPASADPASPLAVTKTANPSPVASGAEITYTITVTNTGGSRVDNVVMSDQLNGVGTIQSPPAAPQFVLTSTKGTCSQSAQLVSCAAGTLQGGETWVATIRGVVTAPGGSTLNNTASVTATRSAQNFTTTATVQTLVQGGGGGGSLPDLTINKTGPSSVPAGSNFAYTLTVNNIGSVNAANIRVVDTLPAGVALVSVNPTSLFTCTPTAAPAPGPTTVVCTGGAVNQGQNATITLNVTAPASGSLTNTASVDPDNTIAETNELNNTSATVNTAVTGTPAQPSLSIVTTDDPAVIAGAGTDPVRPLDKLTYKIRVTNTGSDRADDVVVVDGTQGLEAASIVASQVLVNGRVGNRGGCTVTAPEVRCSVASLDAGGTLTVTIVGTVVAPAGTTIFNTATVTGNIRNVGVSATDTETTTVRPSVDLTVTKADSPDPVCASSFPTAPPGVCVGGLQYTFVVGNSGIDAAANVTVRDVLPAGTVYDSFSNPGGSDFSCPGGPLTGGELVCTNPSIGPSSTESFSIIVVAPAGTGPITNTVTVDPSNALFESDETNNSASATTQVATGADLTIFKFDEPGPTADPASPLIPAYPSPTEGVDPVATNGTTVYTIYVDNIGTQDVTGVRVRDTLPAGTRFLSASGDHGFTCAHDGAATGGNVECQGGNLLGTRSEFYDHPAAEPDGIDPQGNDFATIVIRVLATPHVQPAMHNEVRVDPLNEIPEADEANNIAIQDTVVATGGAAENAFNQLKITKTQTSPAGGAAVATNGTLTYNIHVVNDGTDPVSAIVVKDFLPAGTRFISAGDTDAGPGLADSFFCTHDGAATGGVVTCTGGALSGTLNVIPESSGGGNVPTSRDITITVFAPDTPGTYTNLAKVDPDNQVGEGNEFDNESQVATQVKTAGDGGQNSFNQLTIDKGDSPDPVATSSVLTYTLTVTNSGTNPAFGVKVHDSLPAGTTFLSAADGAPGPNAFNCSSSGGGVDCIGATLSGTAVTASGAPTSRTIVIRVSSPTQPGTITNNAFVDPDNAIPEGDETDNHVQENTQVVVGSGFIDLTVRKCDQPIVAGCESGAPSIVPTGGTIIYRLEVRNSGTDPAFQVVVSDVLPAGTTFVSANDVTAGAPPGGFTCAHSGGVVSCTGGTLDGSADLIPSPDVPTTRTIEIVVRAPSQHNIVVTNQASIDPSNAIPESNETNNQGSETTSIQSPFNLTLEKEGPSTAQQNSEQDYVITVTNAGSAVDDVVVVDALPVGLIPLSIEATPSNFICELTENPVNGVRCVGDMGADGSDTDEVKITIHVFVTQDGGTLDNEACVDPDNAVTENNESDNCDTKTTVLRKFSPNLSVQKTGSDDTVTAGQALTYTVTVSNVGDANADEGWTITDTLPADVSIVGTPVATNGFTCTHDGAATGGVVTCSPPSDADTIGLAVGASTTVTIQTTVGSGADTPFTNTAAVSGAVGFDDASAPCNTATPSDTCEGETLANQGDNSDSVTTSVGGSSIDLVVGDITDNPDPVNVGNSLVYTFVVTNGGTQNALASEGNAVVIRTALPTAGVTLQSGVASQGFACVPTSGVLTCTGDLDAGEATTVTITFTVDALVPPALHLEATADPANAIVELDEANNTAAEDTTVNVTACNSCVELVMGQVFATPSPVTNNSNVVYSFTVTNIGDLSTEADPAPNDVVVGIDLDTTFNDSSFVSFTAGSGFNCVPDTLNAHPTFDVICTSTVGLGPGEGALVTVTASVATAGTPSFVDFAAVVDPDDAILELNNTNNSASLRVDVE